MCVHVGSVTHAKSCAACSSYHVSQADLSLVQTIREALRYLSWENSDLSVKVLDAVSSVCKKGEVQSLYQLALVCLANLDIPRHLSDSCHVSVQAALLLACCLAA